MAHSADAPDVCRGGSRPPRFPIYHTIPSRAVYGVSKKGTRGECSRTAALWHRQYTPVWIDKAEDLMLRLVVLVKPSADGCDAVVAAIRRMRRKESGGTPCSAEAVGHLPAF